MAVGASTIAWTALLAVSASPAAAHNVGGGTMPAPPWLLSYIGAFVVVAAAFALRTRMGSDRPADEPLAGAAVSTRTAAMAAPQAPASLPVTGAGPSSGEAASVRAADRPTASATGGRPRVGQAVGILLLALVLVAAIVGPDTNASNIAPVAVLVVWWVGLPLLCLALGDVMAAINPFVAIVDLLNGVLRRGRPDDPGTDTTADGAPAWTGAAFLGAFAWFFIAYHRPGSPRSLAVLLVVYTLAAVAGGLVWGRRWLATGEGFGALSAAIATVAVRGRRSVVPPGVAALMVVWIGSTAFDGIASTELWLDVAGSSRDWGRTLVNTVGFAWATAVVAGVYLLAVRIADADPTAPSKMEAAPAGEPEDPSEDERLAEGERRSSLAGPLGLALVPVGLAWFVGHDLTLLLFEGQNFLALLSDPIGRGWDLIGTIGNTADFGLARAAWVPWVQVAVLLGGHLACVVLSHGIAVTRLRRRRAWRATWAMAGAAAVSVAVAPLLVLG